jgi:hypothetical protein
VTTEADGTSPEDASQLSTEQSHDHAVVTQNSEPMSSVGGSSLEYMLQLPGTAVAGVVCG